MEPLKIDLKDGEKLFFASDFHLGVPNPSSSRERERLLNKWIDSIRNDAHTLFLLGDIFDFWFEYKKVIPKGFVRFIGKLAEISDEGIEIVIFQGNHDMWMFDYFEKELNARIFKDPIQLTSNGKIMLVGHGDGLGPGDETYKILRKIFRNKVCQALFGILPPRIGLSLAHSWSRQSRISNTRYEDSFLGDEEYLLTYCRQVEKEQHHDYYIFGHRHMVIDEPVGTTSRYINLGEWVHGSHFASWDGQEMKLQKFQVPDSD